MVTSSQQVKKGGAVPEWISCLDKRPSDRTGEDLDIIYSRLKDVKAFEKFHPLLLQQICYYGYYEDLDKGVTLFRQGDIGTNWYTVLSGCLDVNVSETGDHKNSMALCTLGTGTTFGETILTGKPHHATVVTKDYTELIRVEQRDFNVLWERNKQLMEGVFTPLSSLADSASAQPIRETGRARKSSILHIMDEPNPASPITPAPSPKIAKTGHVLRTILLTRAPHMIRDRKFHLRTYRRCMVATEMVEWLIQQSTLVHTRTQAVGIWQAMLEEGVLVHVCHEHYFKDKYLFYRFIEDDQGMGTVPTTADKKQCDESLQDTLALLAKIGPDATLRMVLRKPGEERTTDELETIYEELLHIKALSHLSTMVKRELTHVMVFECHHDKGKILFNQGDEGKSWYIIQKGSVNVVIHGKGMVSTLHEGDDFGKLALVNDAPRAATIVLREDNCHFLRVDKEDFNRILRDVEANTVRLKEHGQDVLVLEKIPMNTQGRDGTVQSHYKYSVMAGAPDKMLEHLLETRLDTKNEDSSDNFLEDFLLTHIIFMPSSQLCDSLMNHYNAEITQGSEQERADYMRIKKKSVIHFVKEWHSIARITFREEACITEFLEKLAAAVAADIEKLNLKEEETTLQRLLLSRNQKSIKHKRKINSPHVTIGHYGDKEEIRKPIKDTDENIFKVYCADHTYTTLSLPMNTSVSDIIVGAQEKLCLGEDLILCEVKSNGERVVYKGMDLCVTTGLSLNGRLFLTPRDHLDALTPLPEQEGPVDGTVAMFEEVSSREVAYHMTVYDWELFMCVHEYELIYHVFGRHKFGKITANLDCLLRRFNEVQYWVVTEMLLTQAVSRRVQLLRKFIKLAAYCYEYQNLNSFFAIVMGLSNIAVSRLSQTWEKLPSKFKRMFVEFETLMDPSRNHRVYRLSVAKMTPPIISFMPLLMKDMTFTHEGNKTYFDTLVNFEKMHMIAQTIRTVRYCRKKSIDIEQPQSIKPFPDVHQYIRNLQVIDNQRLLAQLSHKLEPKRV